MIVHLKKTSTLYKIYKNILSVSKLRPKMQSEARTVWLPDGEKENDDMFRHFDIITAHDRHWCNTFTLLEYSKTCFGPPSVRFKTCGRSKQVGAAAVRDVHWLRRWWGQQVERAVADDRSYYATGECKQAVACRVRQVVVDGMDYSMGKQSVLTTVVVNARWSSMAVVAQNRFYCIGYHVLERDLM